MQIRPIQQNNKFGFQGTINLQNLEKDLLKEDYKKLVSLKQRIFKEPYDITISKTSFGNLITKITHNNGKEIKLKPLNFQYYNQTIPDFIEGLINLIDFK